MTTSTWLLLVINLPGKNQTLRMRVWRGLKTAGAGSLRDGVYLLPASAASRRVFEEQTLEVQAGGGSAHVLPFESDSPAQRQALSALFDRTAEYVNANARIDTFKRQLIKLDEPEARRQLAALRRDITALTGIDFFPGKARAQIEQALVAAEAALNARLSPDEPQPVHGKIARRERKNYRGRVWATREHLWIDRVCSAWLIRRFIDPRAKFLWLKRIKDRPKRAVGFDFDGAEFSHVDSKVTFEVLLVSFGLEKNEGLSRLAALVHYLDVGGIPVGEAAGFSAIMAGTRATQQSDAAMLKTVFPVLDCLYASYSAPDQR
jgi:hypothetical protein